MLRNLAHGLLVALLSLPLLAQATPEDVDAPSCKALAQAVLRGVHAPGDEMRAVGCRTILKESATLVAVAHARRGRAMDTGKGLPIHVALVGMKHGDVRATGQIAIAQDSEQGLDESSLVWDDAPLQPAPGRSAYA